MDDVLIIGAGVVGLSIADELSRRGRSVRVVDRAQPGREASWAGAGILPPTTSGERSDSLESLTAWSSRLHADWAARLADETGIDTGYRRCGGYYVVASAGTPAAESELWKGHAASLERRGVRIERLAPSEIARREPHLSAEAILHGFFLPDEAQVRNPRHVKALIAACERRGVTIESGVEVYDVETKNGQVVSVRTSLGDRSGESVVLCTGAWSGQVAGRIGFTLPVRPVRGQIVLLESSSPLVRSVVNVGHRYLVPRPDGRLLIGSTEEEAGFVKENTAGAIGELIELAARIVPATRRARFAQSWAGLRPATADHAPYLDRAADWGNLFVAAGHFRNGVLWSPATALLMADLIEGKSPDFDLRPFALGR